MQTADKTVYLVSCVRKKMDKACAARDLYISSWFRKARRYAESSGFPWFVLSAEYGLVKPDQCIAPYDRTLNKMAAVDRRAWAERVAIQLKEEIPDLSIVVLLAGARYREFLTQDLKNRGVVVTVPMKGLRVGEQLSWLDKHLFQSS